jgi:hypothetical protein
MSCALRRIALRGLSWHMHALHSIKCHGNEHLRKASGVPLAAPDELRLHAAMDVPCASELPSSVR